jgi:hypothetical protein
MGGVKKLAWFVEKLGREHYYTCLRIYEYLQSWGSEMVKVSRVVVKMRCAAFTIQCLMNNRTIRKYC